MPPCEPDCTKNMTDFNGSDFPPDQDCTHVFLTWKLPVEQASICYFIYSKLLNIFES